MDSLRCRTIVLSSAFIQNFTLAHLSLGPLRVHFSLDRPARFSNRYQGMYSSWSFVALWFSLFFLLPSLSSFFITLKIFILTSDCLCDKCLFPFVKFICAFFIPYRRYFTLPKLVDCGYEYWLWRDGSWKISTPYRALSTFTAVKMTDYKLMGLNFRTYKRITGFNPAQRLSGFSSSLIFGIVFKILLGSFTYDESVYFWSNAHCLFLHCLALFSEINSCVTTFMKDADPPGACPDCTSMYHQFAALPPGKVLQMQNSHFRLAVIADFQVQQVSGICQISTARCLETECSGNLQRVPDEWAMSMSCFNMFFHKKYNSIFLVSPGIRSLATSPLFVDRVFNEQLSQILHLQITTTSLFGVSPLSCFQLLLDVLTLYKESFEFDLTTTLCAFQLQFCVIHYWNPWPSPWI